MLWRYTKQLCSDVLGSSLHSARRIMYRAFLHLSLPPLKDMTVRSRSRGDLNPKLQGHFVEESNTTRPVFVLSL